MKVGRGARLRSGGRREDVDAGDGGRSRRCWYRSVLNPGNQLASSDASHEWKQAIGIWHRLRKLCPPDRSVRLYITHPTIPPPFPSPISHHDLDMRVHTEIPDLLSKQRRPGTISERGVSRSYPACVLRWYLERHVTVEGYVRG